MILVESWAPCSPQYFSSSGLLGYHLSAALLNYIISHDSQTYHNFTTNIYHLSIWSRQNVYMLTTNQHNINN